MNGNDYMRRRTDGAVDLAPSRFEECSGLFQIDGESHIINPFHLIPVASHGHSVDQPFDAASPDEASATFSLGCGLSLREKQTIRRPIASGVRRCAPPAIRCAVASRRLLFIINRFPHSRSRLLFDGFAAPL